MFSLENVIVRFEDKLILDGLSLELIEGQTTCLIGPSGCGKTTLLRVLSGLLVPSQGKVLIPEGKRSFVFQEDRLLPWRTALENLTAVGATLADGERALAQVGLAAERETKPGELSGGMCRRLAIARALAACGDLFFLDEPLRGLDDGTAAPVLRAIREAIKGKTALLITHNPEEALALSDRLLLLSGPPVALRKAADTRELSTVLAIKAWSA